MKKTLVIDWDSQELRTALGTAGRRGLEQATCTSTTWEQAELQGLAAGSLEAVQMLLEGTPGSRGRGVIFARRQHLENFSLAAPPSTNDELPEIVANFLAVELGANADDVLYDYAVLDDDPAHPRRVAISTVKAAVADEYRALGSKLRLSQVRLGLRADGAVALALQQLPASDQATLVIVANAEELDLAVVNGGRVVFWRNVYCSPAGDPAAFREFVAAEAIRTMAVSEDALSEGDHVGRVAVYLGADDDEALIDALSQAMDAPIVRLTPSLDCRDIEGVNVVYEQGGALPGRFAPLLGALVQEAEGRRPLVDFFDRRQPSSAQASRRPLALGALALLTAVGLGGYVMYEKIADAQLASVELRSELKSVQAKIKRVKPDADAWQAIEDWNQSNVVWLDELRDLSIRFPQPGSAVLLDFSASMQNSGAAMVRLSGKARDPAVVTELDGALRDEHRKILSRNLQEQASAGDDPLVWRFESTITAKRRSAVDYRASFEASASQANEEGP